MDEKIKEILRQKEELIKQLDELNASITDEAIANATKEEKMEFTLLTLEINKKLALLKKMEQESI
ncbi:MAG: hypothetical protein FWC79_06675 [Oscillospiraceae bacterium]|nr:hypothetical protein [Oscillospiraceae bacterium]